MKPRAGWFLIAFACIASRAMAQNTVGAISARIDGVRDGTVRFAFASKAGVCGDGQNWFRTRPGTSIGTFSSSRYRDVEVECTPGPVRVVVERREGYTVELRTYVGGRWRTGSDAIDLGTISAPVAAQWLLLLSERDASKAATNAIVAATLADSAEVWPQLLRIAKNESRPREIRNQAVFWVADIAGARVTASLDSLAYDDGDREVRKQAIFALSRRPGDEGVMHLLRMAQTLKDRDLRKTAIFWLGQSKDPRAIAWFEQVLTQKP